MYTVPQSEQLSIFLSALGFGFILGVLYDLMRAIRLSLPASKIATVIFDLLYVFIAGISSFLFILALNKGEIRFYIIFGELVGGAFYYVSFGIAAIKLTNRLSAGLKKFYCFLFKVFSTPFKFIHKNFSLFFKKSEKNSQKLSKKHLPKLMMYVYNLSGMFLSGTKSHGKDGISDGKSKKTKKE